jgi:hypothetical protein
MNLLVDSLMILGRTYYSEVDQARIQLLAHASGIPVFEKIEVLAKSQVDDSIKGKEEH